MEQRLIDRYARRLQSRMPLVWAAAAAQACEALAADGGPEAVPLLLGALASEDPQVRAIADTGLRQLRRPDAVDALCEAAIRDPAGHAARLCIQTGRRPTRTERASLFLFVTKQLDAYFREDYEFQNLRMEYDQADETVREHVMAVIRTGDRRCQDFLGVGRHLHKCTDAQIQGALEAALRRRNWPWLFKAFLQLPMKHGYPLIEHFRKSGWQPEDPRDRSMFAQVLEDAAGYAPPKRKAADTTSSVFERWLAAAPEGTVDTLIEKLKTATPPEGVGIVAALARQCRPDSAASNTVRTHPHWLVRMAGYATGLCRGSLAQDGVKDDNYWICALHEAGALLDLWPLRATPAHLEELESAPREAWVGQFGAVRKVLRGLIGHRMDAVDIEDVVVEAYEGAVEVEEA